MSQSAQKETTDAPKTRRGISSAAPVQPEFCDAHGLEKLTSGAILEGTWRAWRSRGGGPPFFRVGRLCLYRIDVVRAWLETEHVGGAR